MISDSEKEDFEAAIVAAGFEVDDFNVVPLEDVEVPLKMMSRQQLSSTG